MAPQQKKKEKEKKPLKQTKQKNDHTAQTCEYLQLLSHNT